MSALTFCPYCGVRIIGEEPTYCAACGIRLPSVERVAPTDSFLAAAAAGTAVSPEPGIRDARSHVATGEPEEMLVIEGQHLAVGRDLPLGLYRATFIGEVLAAQGQVLLTINGCGGDFGFGLFRADDRSVSVRANSDGSILPVTMMPSWDVLASDLIMGTALVGPDLRPGRYEVESVPAGSTGAAAIRLDDNFMTVADYGYETLQGVASLTVTVESTDFALQFFGTLRHLD